MAGKFIKIQKMKNIKLILALVPFCRPEPVGSWMMIFGKRPLRTLLPKSIWEYEEFTLDNGLQVIAVENHKLPRIAFNLLVDVPPVKEEFAGARRDGGRYAGRGTESRSKRRSMPLSIFMALEFQHR